MIDASQITLIGGSMIASITAIATIDPIKEGMRLGELGASAILGVACVVLVAALIALVRLLVKLYTSFISELRTTVQDNTMALQRVADEVGQANRTSSEVRDAIAKCKLGEHR
jgi:uncharacterized membrane protein YqhA